MGGIHTLIVPTNIIKTCNMVDAFADKAIGIGVSALAKVVETIDEASRDHHGQARANKSQIIC